MTGTTPRGNPSTLRIPARRPGGASFVLDITCTPMTLMMSATTCKQASHYKSMGSAPNTRT